MNFVDLLVLAAILLFAWSGWRNGFVSGLLSFVGFLGGGLIGVFLAPLILGPLGIDGSVGLAATGVLIIGCATAGQLGTSILGRRLHSHITWKPARLLDNVGGAALNVLAIAIIGWILAATATALPSSSVSASVRSSTVLSALDSVVPDQARDAVTNLRNLVDTSGLPQLFDTFGVIPPAPVEAPTAAVVKNKSVQASLNSVVRISGSAPSCGSGFTGSGFVVAPGRVLTNAHVIAGVPEPRVEVPDGGRFSAKTVYFDPRIDVAILEVEGLRAAALKMSGPIDRGTDTVIAGYPGGGDMKATAARVRGMIGGDIARGTDIYGKPGVAREVYALRGSARPGNSGGPLLTTDGRVAGVIYAQAQADPQMAFALTAAQVSKAISNGRTPTQEVSTGECTRA